MLSMKPNFAMKSSTKERHLRLVNGTALLLPLLILCITSSSSLGAVVRKASDTLRNDLYHKGDLKGDLSSVAASEHEEVRCGPNSRTKCLEDKLGGKVLEDSRKPEFSSGLKKYDYITEMESPERAQRSGDRMEDGEREGGENDEEAENDESGEYSDEEGESDEYYYNGEEGGSGDHYYYGEEGGSGDYYDGEGGSGEYYIYYTEDGYDVEGEPTIVERNGSIYYYYYEDGGEGYGEDDSEEDEEENDEQDGEEDEDEEDDEQDGEDGDDDDDDEQDGEDYEQDGEDDEQDNEEDEDDEEDGEDDEDEDEDDEDEDEDDEDEDEDGEENDDEDGERENEEEEEDEAEGEEEEEEGMKVPGNTTATRPEASGRANEGQQGESGGGDPGGRQTAGYNDSVTAEPPNRASPGHASREGNDSVTAEPPNSASPGHASREGNDSVTAEPPNSTSHGHASREGNDSVIAEPTYSTTHGYASREENDSVTAKPTGSGPGNLSDTLQNITEETETMEDVYDRLMESDILDNETKTLVKKLERVRRKVEELGGKERLQKSPQEHRLVRRQIPGGEVCGIWSRRRRKKRFAIAQQPGSTMEVKERHERGIRNLGIKLENDKGGFKKLFNEYKTMCNFLALSFFNRRR